MTPIYTPEEHRQIVQHLQRIGHLDPDVDYPGEQEVSA